MRRFYPPMKPNERLYMLLELDDTITAKQVKWTFRKVSLRSHYRQAYLVLSNATKKHLYDAVGEDAYGFLVSGAWAPLIMLLGTTGSIVAYSVAMLVQAILMLIFFVLLAAKVEHVNTLGWYCVFLPLMIFGMVMCFITFLSCLANLFSPRRYKNGLNTIDHVSPFGNCCAAVCYSCIPFLIAFALEKYPARGVGHYTSHMVLPILGDFFYYLTSLIWRWPYRIQLQMQINDEKKSPMICYGIFFMAFVNMGCSIAQWSVLGQKLDQKLDRSWYIVFIPFCIRACARVVEAFLRGLMRYAIGVWNKTNVAFALLGSFFCHGILLICLYFVAVLLEQPKRPYYLFFAFIPVYATLGYIIVCLVITMVFLLRWTSAKIMAEKHVDMFWIPSDEKDSSLVEPKTPDTQQWIGLDEKQDHYATDPFDVGFLSAGSPDIKQPLVETAVSNAFELRSSKRSPSLVQNAYSPTPEFATPSSRQAVKSQHLQEGEAFSPERSQPRHYDPNRNLLSQRLVVYRDPFEDHTRTLENSDERRYAYLDEEEYDTESSYETESQHSYEIPSDRISLGSYSAPVLAPQLER